MNRFIVVLVLAFSSTAFAGKRQTVSTSTLLATAKLSFDPKKIDKKSLQEIATLAPYGLVEHSKRRWLDLDCGISAGEESNASCLFDATIATLQKKTIEALAIAETLAKVPSSHPLVRVTRYFAASFQLRATLSSDLRRYLQTWDTSVLTGLGACPDLRKELDAAATPLEKYEMARLYWEICATRNEPLYPADAWDAFLKLYDVKERVSWNEGS